ncbi:LuxR C-terminal-related transcriptional regulator [Saxibacter everestensis]|uniref:LuxR C-terminal-related transcriptional regulator n=1 Tax=Saxibacter everestensis TaxID=2909229 RepID=A0ABY8QTG0_9MICO|nr:LuxR C-terminal-related transcriptional regulator [Brevibacteriaceae bacterium ZFBP1038]
MPFVNRVSELEQISAVASNQREASLIVVGGHGYGKTALLEEAARRSANTVHLRVNVTESTWPFSGLSVIFAAIADDCGVDLSHDLDLAVEENTDNFAVASLVLRRIQEAAFPALCIVIDDLDLMDSDSQTIIGFLSRRVQGTGLRIVGSVSELKLDSPFAGLPVIELQELSLDASLELIESWAGPQADKSTVNSIAIAGSGHPLAIEEVLGVLPPHQLSGRDPLSHPLKIGPRTIQQVSPGVASLSEQGKEVLAELSTAELVHSRAVELSYEGEWEGLGELIANDLVTRTGNYVGIRRPIVRSCVYWSITAKDRFRLHQSMWERCRGVDPHGAIWHKSFVTSDSGTPEDLLRSGLALIGQGQIVPAVEFVDRALTLSADNERLAAVLADVAEAMLQHGEFAHTSKYVRHAQRMTNDGAVLLQLASLRVRVEYSQLQTITPGLVYGVVEKYGDRDPNIAAYLLTLLAQYHAEKWDAGTCRFLLKRAERYLRPASSDVLRLHGIVRIFVETLEGESARARDLYDELSRHDLSTVDDSSLAILGRCLTYSGWYHQARDLYSIAFSRYPATSVWAKLGNFLQAENEIRAGSYHRAEEAIEATMSGPSTQEISRTFSRVLYAWYWQAKGDSEKARSIIADAHHLTHGGQDPAGAAQLCAHQGRFAMMRADYAEALRYLIRARDIGIMFQNPLQLQFEGDLVETLVALDRRREATEVLDDFEERNTTHPSRWGTLVLDRSRALVATGEYSLQLFRKLLARFGPQDSDFERARTFSCYGRRLRQLDRSAESRDYFLAAISIYNEIGAISWAAEIEKLISGRTPASQRAQHPMLSRLTDAERLVASRVAAGARNKDIAAELFVSVRTVEVRLTSIYRKLGVHSRSQLTALMSQDADPIRSG